MELVALLLPFFVLAGIIALLVSLGKKLQWRFGRRRPHSAFYDAYIRSEAWREKRREKLREVGYKCEAAIGFHDGCLDVHHRHYRNLGCEKLSDLRVLCHRHHEIEHGRTF